MILGASFDPPDENRAFAEKFDLPFPLLSDEDHSVGERYEVKRHPDEQRPEFPKRRTYLIDPEGLIRKAYRVVDIEPHPRAVLEDLRRLAGR